jgi:hypothetical protein
MSHVLLVQVRQSTKQRRNARCSGVFVQTTPRGDISRSFFRRWFIADTYSQFFTLLLSLQENFTALIQPRVQVSTRTVLRH